MIMILVGKLPENVVKLVYDDVVTGLSLTLDYLAVPTVCYGNASEVGYCGIEELFTFIWWQEL